MVQARLVPLKININAERVLCFTLPLKLMTEGSKRDAFRATKHKRAERRSCLPLQSAMKRVLPCLARGY